MFGDKKSCKENATGRVSIKSSKRDDELCSLNLHLVLAMEMAAWFWAIGGCNCCSYAVTEKEFFQVSVHQNRKNISLGTTHIVQKNLENEDEAAQATNVGGSKPVRIGVAGDTSWNKRTTGYSSSSDLGTHFLIGLETKKIIAYCAMLQCCSECERGSLQDEHN